MPSGKDTKHSFKSAVKTKEAPKFRSMAILVLGLHFHTPGPSSFGWTKQSTKCSNKSHIWKPQQVLHSTQKVTGRDTKWLFNTGRLKEQQVKGIYCCRKTLFLKRYIATAGLEVFILCKQEVCEYH